MLKVTLKTGLLVANGSSLPGVVELPAGCHHEGKVSARAHLPHLLVYPKVNLNKYNKIFWDCFYYTKTG
jgi:hypothetical protein